MRARRLCAVTLSRAAIVALTVLLWGCQEASAPGRPVPATLHVVGNPIPSAPVGTNAGNFTVLVKDANGQPLSGVVVSFTVAQGAGRVNPATDTSRADGSATSSLTLGTVPGHNQVTAAVIGVAPVKSAAVTGLAGPAQAVSITPRALRFVATRANDFVNASSRDGYGNSTGAAVTWISRNVGLVSVTPGNGNNAAVQVVGRPGQTWVVATAAGVSDSIQVSVLDAASSPCRFAADPVTIPIGGAVPIDHSGFACIRSPDAGAEYVLIANNGTPASSTLALVEVVGTGIVSPPATSVAELRSDLVPGAARASAFESALRERERAGMAARAVAARSWYASKSASIVTPAREGDISEVNVNAFEFCDAPVSRAARVVAITNSAVILADTLNPSGGFSPEEYRAIGIAMDTLVVPVDTTAFGVPTDIDGNDRVAILFTSAVNELTPRASTSGVALGFFFSRDLLPKESATGACPGSNTREMFYVLVPDPAGTAGDPRSKAFVQGVVISTLAHEYQHLINASRRLYVNETPSLNEELWLNEGLSHIAEELVFYRASNLLPRQNIGPTLLQSGTETRASFEAYARGNFSRYVQYLRDPELNSPIANDDFLATRGATWAFLRYLADRAAPTDGNLWHRVANSRLTGVANLDDALGGTGLTMLDALRDWSVAVVLDDNPAGSNAAFQQPSWNFVGALPAVGMTFPLSSSVLLNGTARLFSLRAAGSSYMRFGVSQNQEALIQGRGTAGLPLPSWVRLTVVRTR